ncbi:AGAP013332-PA-like protein [Anopheles sinensis]|uniref:AGAP013332-PA-like protein n=1 Tax=Anopheles sinensis TaxID=74873 RepID=A0A084W053_ANOSI|nr:AGAP013332-PA-like protein [Anopheles sinensis]
MSKRIKTPKISPEELSESIRQEKAKRYELEQERLRTKAVQEHKEYNQRRVLLLETTKLFRKIEKIASDYRSHLSKKKEWTDFLSCRRSPNPNNAAELRETLFRWVYLQEEACSKSLIGWTLSGDISIPISPSNDSQSTCERNRDRINKNIREIYVVPVREALSVLESIANGSMEKQHEEILTVRDEIRKFITDSLNRMTLQVGSSVCRTMESLNPLMSEFSFDEPDVLVMFLWSFRPVPLPLENNFLMKVIDMAPLGLTIHRPQSLDLKDFLIRGLWLEFDHFSNQDPTQDIAHPESTSELLSVQETEWNERQEIRRKRLAALRKHREEFEAQERLKQAEADTPSSKTPKEASGKAKKAKSKEDAKKGRKIVNQSPEVVPEPPVITEETEVDIDAEYEHQETDQFWASLSSVAPGALPLEEGYMNLREYCIVGGIYKLTRFDKLPQPIDLGPRFMYSNVPVGLQLSEKGFHAVDEEELIKIELQLPAHCFWWEHPTICRWESWEESENFARLHPEVQQFQLRYADIEAHKATLLFAARENDSSRLSVPTTIPDFDLADIPPEVRLHYLIREHILPRLPDGYRFRAELKRLYTVLKEKAEHRMCRGREQAARHTMMLMYNRIIEASNHDGGLGEMRHPEQSDIDAEEPLGRSVADHSNNFVELQEIDEKLQQLSLARPNVARYLHPPKPLHRPLCFAPDSDRSDASFDELGADMERLVLTLESQDTMLDDEAEEWVCKMFSIFLRLLEYLRERLEPCFPSVPPASPPIEKGPEPRRIAVREIKRRFIDIRTTKKYPLGLGSRDRSLSRASGSSVASGEKKKRKRKSTPVRGKLTSHPEPFVQDMEKSEDPPEVLSLIEHAPGRWSNKPIRRQLYDANKRMLTFWTDRLGIFGLAARKYIHLPFLHWEMRRHGRVANMTTVLTLSAFKMKLSFFITSQGYRVHVQECHSDDSRQKEAKDDEVGIRIAPEIGWFSLEELGKYLLKINVHVFPEVDTCFYTAGRQAGSATVPKHEAMELHNLRCFGAFCLTHNLQRCVWNEFANRRTGLVLGRQLIEGRHEPEFETIMITPLKSQLVEVEELCSNTLEEVHLAFHPRPSEQSYNADCYGLLKERLEEPSRKVLAKTPPLLQWNVSQLLQRLRLLSYS